MSNLGGGENEGDSSEDEWVLTSVQNKKKLIPIFTKKQQRPDASSTAIRTTKTHTKQSLFVPSRLTSSTSITATLVETATHNQNASQGKDKLLVLGTASPSDTVAAAMSTLTVTTATNSPRISTTAGSSAGSPTLSLQYVSDAELEVICKNEDSKLLVTRLVEVYKCTEIFLKIREIETNAMMMESRLKDHLHLCENTCDFILDTFEALSDYFVGNHRNKDLTLKFRRLLTSVLCNGLSKFLVIPIDQKYDLIKKPVKEEDLISFDDIEVDLLQKDEVDLICLDDDADLFDPVINNNNNNNADETTTAVTKDTESDDEDDEDEEDEEEEVITMSDILGVPTDIIDRYTLTRNHQIKLIQMMDILPSPIIIYYALDTFQMATLMSSGCEYEDDGVKICEMLMRHAYYEEAIGCIRKFKLYNQFPVNLIAERFFTAGQGMHLPLLYSDQPFLQQQLLSYINKQLRFNYAGSLDIVPKKYLQDLIDGTDTTQQLSRLKERRFQKDLANCASKLLKDLNILNSSSRQEDYFFIYLSQRYACLRFILTQRSFQQMEDENMSIEASSNFNGLVDLVCQDDPVLARLAIKELVDTEDANAPAYFAARYKQQDFYCRYNALPLNQRLLGVVKGETLSRHRNTLPPSSSKKRTSKVLPYYILPPKAQTIMVDSYSSLIRMKDILANSKAVGIDSEWVPTFAKSSSVKTALMQIASDFGNFIFLLDLKTIFQPENEKLLALTELILKTLFEDIQIIKIAYDFTGDLDLLHSSISSSKKWKMTKLLDLKNLKTMPTGPKDHGQPITGGLAGVVSTVLGVNVNKRQQLSNWEQRPLSEEQIIYGACDAYCLLDLYFVLQSMDHPILQSFSSSNTATTLITTTITKSKK